jgi:hypothetical protein
MGIGLKRVSFTYTEDLHLNNGVRKSSNSELAAQNASEESSNLNFKPWLLSSHVDVKLPVYENCYACLHRI